MAGRIVLEDAAEAIKGKTQVNAYVDREIATNAKIRVVQKGTTLVRILNRLLHLYATNAEVQKLVDELESKG